MSEERLDRLVRGQHTSGSHGIGFRVVQNLVHDSDGDLRVMSSPETGTIVQIEWPIDTTMLAVATEIRKGPAEMALRMALPLDARRRQSNSNAAYTACAGAQPRRSLVPPAVERRVSC
jgi:signal transduction histidine kinase